jgi:hypothetical protein
VYPGDRGYYDRVTRKVHCLGCGSPSPERTGAGASAGREHRRRRAAHEARIRRRVPFGAAFLARVTEPQHARAWAKGQRGEERGAQALETRLDGKGVLLLHDRRKPHSRGNIDHLAVGPGGVTVIDSKNVTGRVRVETRGFVERRPELRVAGRDRTSLVAGVEDQVRAVRELLAARGLPEVEVRGALQFIDGELPLGGLRDVRAIALGGPRKAARLAARAGEMSSQQVEGVHRVLERALPPA